MTSVSRFRRAGILAGAVASLVACTAVSTEESDSTDQEIRIKPVGTETMSTLILQLPTGTCLPGGACARPLGQAPGFTLDGAAMTLGQGLRVLPGPHTLVVGSTSTTVNLVAGATRTMVIPVVKRVCTNAVGNAAPDTDFGRVPTLRYASCPTAALLDGKPIAGGAATVDAWVGTACDSTFLYSGLTRGDACNSYPVNAYNVSSVRLNGVCYRIPTREIKNFCQTWVAQGAAGIGAGGGILTDNTAVVPGLYSFPIENNAGGVTNEDRTVAEGDVKDLTFTLPQIGSIPDRFSTVLNFADARELPDAIAPTITSNCERNYAVPASAQGTVSLKAFQYPACTYSLNVSGRAVALNQAAANNVSLHRVDVDDVVVTREDGSTFVVKGTYELYFGGQKVAGPYSTNSGIDVLDGAYELVVKYTTADGAKTNRYNVAF